MGAQRKTPKEVHAKCVGCGCEFVHIERWFAPIPKYCSDKCRSSRMVSLNPRGMRNISKICVVCGKSYLGFKAKNNLYCSAKCRQSTKIPKNLVLIRCNFCSKSFLRRPDKINLTNYCDSKCMAGAKKLEFPRSGKFAAVRKWFSRFGRMAECEHCGYKAFPGILVLHHKDRDRTNNTRENLAVLCPNCHAIEHLDENKNGWQHHSKDPRKIELRRKAAEKRLLQ